VQGLALLCSGYPNLPAEDGINAIRRILPRCWFELGTTDEGVKALRQYRRDWDDVRKVFLMRAVHDWTSHPTDAFRYMAVGLNDMISSNRQRNLPKRDLAWIVGILLSLSLPGIMPKWDSHREPSFSTATTTA